MFNRNPRDRHFNEQMIPVVAEFCVSTERFYINGSVQTLLKVDFATLNKCSSNKIFLIGGWWKNDLISLHGSIDELRIYDRALNQDQTNELAKSVQ